MKLVMFIIGLFVGVFLGIFIAALANAANSYEDDN